MPTTVVKPPPVDYRPSVRVAFKEWAIVADALGRGDQILILRKGGIREGPGGFQVEHPMFLLFSTLFHQQRDAVLQQAQARFDELVPHFPKPEILRLEFFAEIAAWQKLETLAEAERLRGQHIWRDDVIAQRYDWGKGKNIFALAVRVFRLPGVIELPMRPGYGGCKSWVELETDVITDGARPVLSEAAFTVKLKQFHSALAKAEVS